jgi:hypothetical protein
MEQIPRRMRRVLPAAAVLALAVMLWAWADPGSIDPVPVSPRAGAASGPARPVPAMDGWQPVGDGPVEGAGGLRLYQTGDPPEVAAVRASGCFRAAGWTPLPAPPRAADAEGRSLLAFRSGGAVCWVLAERDPRTGQTRCAVLAP